MLRISVAVLVLAALFGSLVVDAALSPSLRARRQLPTKNSVVATPLGLVNVPPGSSVEPADSPNPGILVNPSVVDTPAGLVNVPGGAKVVPGK
ncbi:hypothetical protein AAVH_20679 [Aphelenchoides avenae]|nr:hypothetical protein AAVH_20679 [Aphelenchus avenae]